MEQAEDTTTNHGRERQWKVAIAESQVDRRQHSNYSGWMRMRHDKRRRQRGGQAGGCEAEVPQDATQQPVGANERQMGGGVAGAMQCRGALRVAVLARGWEAEAAQQDVTQQPAGVNEGGGSRMDT
jgi:hypothetical protein